MAAIFGLSDVEMQKSADGLMASGCMQLALMIRAPSRAGGDAYMSLEAALDLAIRQIRYRLS
jgi:hypothetical protein